jgi:elongator complex protein 3
LPDLKGYSKTLIKLIESGSLKSRHSLNEEKIRLCKKYGLNEMPTNATILSFAKRRSGRLVSLLKVKPTRSLSGIAVVAIMSKPGKCPGQCIYCPGSLLPNRKTPKSYTGEEPATMRALAQNFDAKKQVENRLSQLHEAGHSTGKVELIVMGGTFLSHPVSYQKKFMLSSINALCGSRSKSLEAARKKAELSRTRITGITFETRPDYCGKKEINRMLSFGGTRCELGVQTIYDSVYKRINRGHSIKDVVKATALLKDSAFKVTYHYMPGLPNVSLAEDKAAIRKLFKSPDFRPDNLKIYPCLVIQGTELFSQWKKGLYKEFSTDKAIKLLAYAKQFMPRWVRIMRIQRDIPAQLIEAGVKKSNLRQLIQDEMHSKGLECSCIRCREAGLSSAGNNLESLQDARLFVEDYGASKGIETFISFEDRARKCLFGFARLRFPNKPFRKEISQDTALLRELRVFGLPLQLHQKSPDSIQHKGLGKRLLMEAEAISQDKGMKSLAVISGLGVKPYYYAQAFKRKGLFVSKKALSQEI